MSFELWFSFVVAAGILIAIPGPTNFLVMAYALRLGIKPALGTIFGVVPGVTLTMSLSFIGLGAILATSAQLFVLMKWAGALYLIYLGIRQWRADPTPAKVQRVDQSTSMLKMMAQAFIVTALNPKGIVFFVAFMPQFITPHAPALPQMIILVVTFNLLVLPINTTYVFLAGGLREKVTDMHWLKAMNRAGGGALVAAGLMTASLRRT